MKMKKWHKIALSAVALGAACGLGYYFGIHNKVDVKELDDVAWSGYYGGVDDAFKLLNYKTSNLIGKETFKECEDTLRNNIKLTVDHSDHGLAGVTRHSKGNLFGEKDLF